MEKHFDYRQVEKQVKDLWERERVFACEPAGVTSLSHAYTPQIYTVDTPPPTVSGKLHIGHVFSYTHTDIIVRYKRLKGFSIFYPLGFDDNGLPTERFVELKHNISPHQVGRTAFSALCRQEAELVEEEFKSLWQRLGLSVDWNKVYSTISPDVIRLSQQSFLQLLCKGYIYRKEEPALYCTASRTSVSQADLEDVEKSTLFSDIEFKTTSGEVVVIGTTRPELLHSCVALFYHPEDPRYKHLEGKKVLVPFYGHEVPALADEKVQIDKGTGLVMCCTFGDKTDIEWFKTYRLPYRPSIGYDGKMLPETGPLAGQKVPEARLTMLELLKTAGLVVKQRTIIHMVNVYERSKKEVEFLMLPQWFVKILPFKKELLALAEEIEWAPAFMKTRYIDWVEHLQWDWCISRQRYSGVPFPVWYNKLTGEMVLPSEDQLPLDPREKAAPAGYASPDELIPDTDVMDTWNTSSLTPFICKALFTGSSAGLFDEAADDGFLPMSMRPQAHDIIRTWAFYTMVKSWMHCQKAPWKSIVISGHVLSPDGGKISKSKGNNPMEPERLLEAYPADVIRYWTASGTLGHDVAFSENTLKIGNKLVVKLWNACRLVEEHMEGVSLDEKPRELGALNGWLLHRMTEMVRRYEEHFEMYEFSLALGVLEQFFWNDFCDNYLELIKFHFFRSEQFLVTEVQATRWTLAHAMIRLLQLFAPFIPFITEELYQGLFRDKVGIASLNKTQFDQFQIPFEDAESIKNIGYLMAVVDTVRRLKSEQKLSLKTELAECLIVAELPALEFLKTQKATIDGVSSAKVVLFAPQSTGSSFIEERGGQWFMTVRLS